MKILSDKGFSEKAAKLILKAERESVDGLEIDESGTAKNADKILERDDSKNYADFACQTNKAARRRQHLQHRQHKSLERLRALWLKNGIIKIKGDKKKRCAITLNDIKIGDADKYDRMVIDTLFRNWSIYSAMPFDNCISPSGWKYDLLTVISLKTSPRQRQRY
jgi:hypothetical protein